MLNFWKQSEQYRLLMRVGPNAKKILFFLSISAILNDGDMSHARMFVRMGFFFQHFTRLGKERYIECVAHPMYTELLSQYEDAVISADYTEEMRDRDYNEKF